MFERQNLDTKIRRLYFICHDDGLIDIVVGLIALGFGLIIASDKVIFWLIFYIFGIGIWRASKQWIPYHRFSSVKSNEKKSINHTILIGMIVANLVLLFILALILLNLKGVTA